MEVGYARRADRVKRDACIRGQAGSAHASAGRGPKVVADQALCRARLHPIRTERLLV